ARSLDGASKAKWEALRRSLADTSAKLAAAPPSERVYAVSPRPPEATHLLERGNPGQKAKALTAGGVASLGLKADFGLGTDASDADRRRKLAEWITDTKNPLFARVMVNRLWH